MTANPPDRPSPSRVLFLDDDPRRAEAFLAVCSHAVWVTTAEECIGQLDGPEPWDEVHLDHDLGGETYVASHREDCGMEVVRWLCREAPKPHLQKARFVVHSWNADAAFGMTLQLELAGYRVVARPFGTAESEPEDLDPGDQGLPSSPLRGATWSAWADRLLSRLRPRRRPEVGDQDAESTIDPPDQTESGH